MRDDDTIILQTLAPLHGVDAPSELLHMRSAVGFIYFVLSHWSIRQSLVPRHVWIHHQTCYTCGAPWVWFTVLCFVTLIYSADSSASARGGYTIRVVTHAERRGFICLDCNTRRFGEETRTIACRMSTHMLPSLVWEALAVTSCRSHETALCRPFSHLRVFVRLVLESATGRFGYRVLRSSRISVCVSQYKKLLHGDELLIKTDRLFGLRMFFGDSWSPNESHGICWLGHWRGNDG